MLKARVVDIQQVQPAYLKEGTAEREADEAKLAAAVAAGLRAAPGLVVEELPDEPPAAPRRRGAADVGTGG